MLLGFFLFAFLTDALRSPLDRAEGGLAGKLYQTPANPIPFTGAILRKMGGSIKKTEKNMLPAIAPAACNYAFVCELLSKI